MIIIFLSIGRIWTLSINNGRSLNTIGILSFTSELFNITVEEQLIKVCFTIDTNHQVLCTI